MSKSNGKPKAGHCIICGKKIKVQIYKNTEVCSENCRKDRDGDHEPARIGYVSGR
jgi:predicted nucleic acid-binding Zn ribbon protein